MPYRTYADITRLDSPTQRQLWVTERCAGTPGAPRYPARRCRSARDTPGLAIPGALAVRWEDERGMVTSENH
jgi:hypothetical protein